MKKIFEYLFGDSSERSPTFWYDVANVLMSIGIVAGIVIIIMNR